jgi:hypothetical protein
MTQQPTLFSQPAPVSRQSPDPRSSGNPPRSPQTPLWLQYLELSVRVVVRIYLGLVIIVLPWTHFWTDNHLLVLIPHLSKLAFSGAARGIISGLGLLNIWIGVYDAIHYKQR